MTDVIQMKWKLHTPNLLGEILRNDGWSSILRPVQMLGRLLALVANRAIELDDPELNALMCRMALYTIADPESEDYDRNAVNEILANA